MTSITQGETNDRLQLQVRPVLSGYSRSANALLPHSRRSGKSIGPFRVPLWTSAVTTSLFLAILGLVPPNDPNLYQSIGKDMHECLALAVRSAMPKQLELFSSLDLLPVLPEKVMNDLNSSANDGGLGVAAPVNCFAQLVQVSPTQTNQNLLNDGLHVPSNLRGELNTLDNPEHPKVHPVYTCNTNDIRRISHFPGSVTADISSVTSNKTGIQSASLPQAENSLKVPSPEECDEWRRSPLDHILGRPRADHRDKPTLDQVRRARAQERTDFFTERVLSRLELLEAHEPNNSFKSDYRQAFICVSLASKGNTEPFLSSSYAVHGIHQDKVWPRIVNNRKERLGKLYYQFFFSNDMPRPDVKWDETPIYDLPTSSAANRTTSSTPAAEIGAGDTPTTAPKQPAPIPNIQEKERLA